MNTENKLKGRDLINVGIYGAIYFVILFAIAMLGMIPVFLPLLSVLVPLIGGVPFMMFLTKVKKPGMIFIFAMIMGVMMLLILLIMIIKVLPVFRRVLANFGVEMTDSGNAMMRMGVTAGWVMFAAVALFVIAVLVCCVLAKTGHKAKVLAFLGKAVPALKNVRTRLASARVASVLSTMLESGFPLDEALEMVPAVLEDDVAAEKIGAVREKIVSGEPFAEALAGTGLFDEFYSGMIRTSAAVGCVDSMMAKVAAEYEDRAEEGIANLVSIIEPTLVAVLSIAIGAVLLSVMLPMAGIISSIL